MAVRLYPGPSSTRIAHVDGFQANTKYSARPTCAPDAPRPRDFHTRRATRDGHHKPDIDTVGFTITSFAGKVRNQEEALVLAQVDVLWQQEDCDCETESGRLKPKLTLRLGRGGRWQRSAG